MSVPPPSPKRKVNKEFSKMELHKLWGFSSHESMKIEGVDTAVCRVQEPGTGPALARLITLTYGVQTAVWCPDGWMASYPARFRQATDVPTIRALRAEKVEHVMVKGSLPIIDQKTVLGNHVNKLPIVGGRRLVDPNVPLPFWVGEKKNAYAFGVYVVPFRTWKLNVAGDWLSWVGAMKGGLVMGTSPSSGDHVNAPALFPMTEGIHRYAASELRSITMLNGGKPTGDRAELVAWSTPPSWLNAKTGPNLCVGAAIAGALAGRMTNPVQMGLFKTDVFPLEGEAPPVNFGLAMTDSPGEGHQVVPAAQPPRFIQTRGHYHAGTPHYDWSSGLTAVIYYGMGPDGGNAPITEMLRAHPDLFAPGVSSRAVSAALERGASYYE